VRSPRLSRRRLRRANHHPSDGWRRHTAGVPIPVRVFYWSDPGQDSCQCGWSAKGQIGSPEDVQRAECKLRVTVSFKSGGACKFHWADPFRAVEPPAVPISLVSPTIRTTICAVLPADSALGRPLAVGPDVLITGATAPPRALSLRVWKWCPVSPAPTRPVSAARRVPLQDRCGRQCPLPSCPPLRAPSSRCCPPPTPTVIVCIAAT